MAREFFGDRKKALEESFFARENARSASRRSRPRGTRTKLARRWRGSPGSKATKSSKNSAHSESMPIPGRRFRSRRWSKSPGRMERSTPPSARPCCRAPKPTGLPATAPGISCSRAGSLTARMDAYSKSGEPSSSDSVRGVGRERARIPEATRSSVARAASPRRPAVFSVSEARISSEEEIILAELAKAFEV